MSVVGEWVGLDRWQHLSLFEIKITISSVPNVSFLPSLPFRPPALAEEYKVALVAGSGFDSAETVRISYATSMDILQRSMKVCVCAGFWLVFPPPLVEISGRSCVGSTHLGHLRLPVGN